MFGGVAVLMIERRVVGEVDEELRRAPADRIDGARHGDRAAQIAETVVGSPSGIGSCTPRASCTSAVPAARLDHEACNDAVNDGAVIVTLLRIAQEVGDSQPGACTR